MSDGNKGSVASKLDKALDTAFGFIFDGVGKGVKGLIKLGKEGAKKLSGDQLDVSKMSGSYKELLAELEKTFYNNEWVMKNVAETTTVELDLSVLMIKPNEKSLVGQMLADIKKHKESCKVYIGVLSPIGKHIESYTATFESMKQKDPEANPTDTIKQAMLALTKLTDAANKRGASLKWIGSDVSLAKSNYSLTELVAKSNLPHKTKVELSRGEVVQLAKLLKEVIELDSLALDAYTALGGLTEEYELMGWGDTFDTCGWFNAAYHQYLWDIFPILDLYTNVEENYLGEVKKALVASTK